MNSIYVAHITKESNPELTKKYYFTTKRVANEFIKFVLDNGGRAYTYDGGKMVDVKTVQKVAHYWIYFEGDVGRGHLNTELCDFNLSAAADVVTI